MNGYELSRIWFDFCFENPEKIKPNHTALYFFAIEHCNRLGWKEKYGLPTTMVKEAIGIRSYNTYINTLNDLVDWGFIKMIERSKNQHSSNIVALSKFNKALDKALDKALIKHAIKQGESTSESIDSIDKPLNNKPIKPLNNKQKNANDFSFTKELISLGVEEQILKDWMKVRRKKKATDSLTSLNAIKKQIELSGKSANECIRICVEKDWKGFSAEWLVSNQPRKENTLEAIAESAEDLRKLFKNDPTYKD